MESRQHLRILHTEWSLGWGGQEIRILGETQALIKLGYVAEIAAQPHGQLFKKAQDSGITVHPVRMHKGLALGALWRLVRIIQKKRIDIVHTHSSVDARLGGLAARITGKRIVRSRHLSTPIKNNWPSWILYMRLADHVITSGESIRQAMIHNNKMYPQQITSTPAGVDTERFYPRQPDIALRKELGLLEQHFVIGIVAVLRSWKGHRSLYEAIALYKKSNPNIRLLVLGDGPTRNNLEALRKELEIEEHVFMLGHITDTPRYYSIMDGVILTSYSNEATSQTLPQAMLMGKPVIGTNIGSIPEVVIDGVTGILIPPKNPEQIVKALDSLYKNETERNTLALQGRSHALAHFTKKVMMDSTIAVYEKVLTQ
jgi:glycosyltransferase involved in cell wall biosynthesis